MRSPRRSGNTLPSQGPRAKTNDRARTRLPSESRISASSPSPTGGRTAATRTSPPLRATSAATACTDRRAIKAPPRGSWIPQVTSPKSICGQRASSCARSRRSCGNADAGERLQGRARPRVLFVRHPEHARLVEERRASAARGERLPLLERSPGPARVELVRSVAHAQDARLSARAGAAAGGTVGVDERDRLPCALEVPRRPGPEDAGSDDGRVVDHAARPRGGQRMRPTLPSGQKRKTAFP